MQRSFEQQRSSASRTHPQLAPADSTSAVPTAEALIPATCTPGNPAPGRSPASLAQSAADFAVAASGNPAPGRSPAPLGQSAEASAAAAPRISNAASARTRSAALGSSGKPAPSRSPASLSQSTAAHAVAARGKPAPSRSAAPPSKPAEEGAAAAPSQPDAASARTRSAALGPLLKTFHVLNIRGLKTATTNSVPYTTDILHDPSLSSAAMSLTETWLHDHQDAEIKVPDFQLFRVDRKRAKKRKGRASGGVLTHVHDSIAAEKVFEFSSGVIECVGVMLESMNLMMYTIYRQPDEKNHRSTNQHFAPLLSKLREHLASLPTPTPDIMLQGDFNLPHADWETGECSKGASKDEKKMVRAFYELTLENFLVQQVEGSTHRCGNTLDLIFCNNADMVHSTEVLPANPSVTDHNLIQVNVDYKSHSLADDDDTSDDDEPDAPDARWRALNFQSPDVNWDALSADLMKHKWDQEYRYCPGVTEMSDRFNEACLTISERHVPRKRKSSPRSNIIPRHRVQLMRNRVKILKCLKTTIKASKKRKMHTRLTEIEASLRVSRATEETHNEAKAVDSIRKNPKFFFSYANKHSKVRTGIGPLRTKQRTLTNSPKAMADILAEQYNSAFSQPVYSEDQVQAVFRAEPPPNSGNLPTTSAASLLENINFSDEELAEAMRELRANSAAGPDGFPAILLKKCSNALAPPLARLWRASLREGVIPATCKSANIVPIHKGKSKAVPKNYRPVALTSQLSKVFEKVVRKHMVSFLEEHKLLNPTQHGFRAGRSCLSQLLNHFDIITSHLEHGRGVDVVYLDFAKAFDKVDIGVTLRKLHHLGVRGRLGRWLTSFLTGRTQTVLVSGKQSAPQPVQSGVPQGSVLGPLIFLILLGNINEGVSKQAFLSSFADDTRLGMSIASARDALLLQDDLNKVYAWSKEVNMEFNSDKFEMLRYQANKSKPRPPQTLVSNVGTPIKEMQYLRDLGVTMSNDASFSLYIHEKVSAVKKLCGWALRTFKTRARLPMLTLWKCLLQCHADYCSQLWSPTKKGEIQALEDVQRCFINKIAGMQGLSYWQQLAELKMYSLERRRERYSIVYTWRIIEGLSPNLENTPINAKWHPRRGRACVVPPLATTAPKYIQSTRFSSFAYRGPRLFNTMPREVKDMTGCTVEMFKTAVDRALAQVPDEPLAPGLTQQRRAESNSLLHQTVNVHGDT